MEDAVVAVEPDGRWLVGDVVRLDAGRPADASGLFAALDDARVYAGGYGGGPLGRPRDLLAFDRWWSSALADPRRSAVYVVRLVADGPFGPAGTIVGTSSLGDVSVADERVHLGWTAYAPAVWGSAVNPECKLLLLAHAFDDCRFGRVKIQTDVLNTRSQAAIARLGAVREGVLRRHQARADLTFRDTVVFSILRDEWPAVRDGLRRRVASAFGPRSGRAERSSPPTVGAKPVLRSPPADRA
jgi:RimJ/RimL family protein N-acetyltransferase